MAALEIFKLNPALDREALRARFLADTRVQVRDVLEPDAAADLARFAFQHSPWGLTWQAKDDGPHRLRKDQLGSIDPARFNQMGQKLHQAMAGGEFAFIYSQYTASASAGSQWSAGPRHDALVTELNHPDVIGFMRDITGEPDIEFCDVQFAHFGPGQFLAVHEDVDAFDGDNRVVAYVLNLTVGEWRPDWGGYLNFFNEEGDVILGLAPRFNCMNVFKVPQLHQVSLVAPFATGQRLTIGGWYRRGPPPAGTSG